MDIPGPPRFLVDAMLGNVARDLRLLGYDTEYAGRSRDAELVRICQKQSRILVTRDTPLYRRSGGVESLLVKSANPDLQTIETLAAFDLHPEPEQWMTRCLSCNGLLRRYGPTRAHPRVPDHIASTHTSYSQCPCCDRIYWEGTHASRLRQRCELLSSPLPLQAEPHQV